MKSIDIHISTMRHPFWISASPTQRGAWISLVIYSSEQETDGIIVGARAWTVQQWIDNIGEGMVRSAYESPLWKWIDNDMHLELYPRRRMVV